MENKKIKVAVLYRVIQHWRAPMFERISKIEGVDLIVYYGADFKGTKVVSGTNLSKFKSKKLFTIKIKWKIGNKSGRQMPLCPFLFWQLVMLSPDVVLTEGSSNFANAIQGYLYAKLFGKKIIWWGLGRLQNEEKDSIKDSFINYFEKRCNAHIVYSSVGETYYSSLGYPKQKIFTAVNVVDTDRIAEIRQSKNFITKYHSHKGFNILYVGALTKVKKVDLLIEAFALLEQKNIDVFLNIIGTGPERKNLEELAKLHKVKNIHFHGQIIEGLYEYFAISDVFVLPGLGGLAISEAMAYGLPVIASIGDGCEVNLIDSTNGIVDVSMDHSLLAGYLEDMYNNPEKLQRLKQASLNRIATKYNVNTYIDRIADAIHYVMKN